MQNSGAFTQEVETRLWLPGTNAADARVRAVARAVSEYDEALRLAKHEITGDWVVVIGERGHPVFGFGPDLPGPTDVAHLLGKHDMKRRGPELLAQSAKEADAKRVTSDYAMDQRHGELAEQLVFHTAPKVGEKPYIYVPRSIPGA